MSALSERLGADPGVPFRLGVEQRYPLRLSPAAPELGELYADACVDVWDPEEVVDRDALVAMAGDEGAPTAAAAWVWAAGRAYRGITESDALLVRMCIESTPEPEVKYLLTTRAQTGALAAEACWAVATALGGGDPAVGMSGERPGGHTARGLLHAEVSADAAFVSRVLIGDRITAAWWETVLADANAPVAAIAARLLRDRARMVAFGQAYTAGRLATIDLDARAAVASAVAEIVVGLTDVPDLPDAGGGRSGPFGAPAPDISRRAMVGALADLVVGLRAKGLAIPDDIRRSA